MYTLYAGKIIAVLTNYVDRTIFKSRGILLICKIITVIGTWLKKLFYITLVSFMTYSVCIRNGEIVNLKPDTGQPFKPRV